MTENLQADINAVNRIPMVDTLLEVVCRTTGMGFAAIARVTDHDWVACSVHDDISLGIQPGTQLKAETTLCSKVKQSGLEIMIDNVSATEEFAHHYLQVFNGLESYISFPIFLADGSFFGTLCAADPTPAKLDSKAIGGMMRLFCDLIATHLNNAEHTVKNDSLLSAGDQNAELLERYNNELNFANERLAATQKDLEFSVQQLSETKSKQAMLAAIVESSEDAIVSKTLDGIITSWNRSAVNLFGYTEKEAIGSHITLIIPKDRLDEEALIISKIRRGERIEHFETLRRTKSGEEIALSITVSPILNDLGQVIGASKTARDISKQKASEERLQNYAEHMEILNSIGQTISADLDTQSILQKVTDATTQLTGAAFGAFFYNRVNKKVRSDIMGALSGTSPEKLQALGLAPDSDILLPTFRGEGVVRLDDINRDCRYTAAANTEAGAQPLTSFLAIPVKSKNGEVIGALFFGHHKPARFRKDHEQLVAGVAAQASIALENARLYDEIKLLNAKKDEFIGLASHELKTPVTSINGYLQIIERGLPAEDKYKALVGKALAQVGKLTTLIADLLDVSKIQTGKLPFSYTTFNIVGLLNEVTEIMQQNYNSHQISFECPYDEMMIVADHQRIEQVIINLITNAVKYSPGANQVIVKADITADKLRVTVRDFGIGIAKDQQERIFSRFYRVENLAAHMSGLGIGLYICHEIIYRHKGHLWVDSDLGQGSTFGFDLPLAKV